jgi:hypothetical protein
MINRRQAVLEKWQRTLIAKEAIERDTPTAPGSMGAFAIQLEWKAYNEAVQKFIAGARARR